MSHFKTHMNGYCNYGSGKDHEIMWEEVKVPCIGCGEPLFKFKCKREWPDKAFEVNALHIISCFKVLCRICKQEIERDGPDYLYYKHFYINGISSDLKDIVLMCPYKTFIETEDKNLYPCHICINLKEEKGQYSRNTLKYQMMKVKSSEFTQIEAEKY